jgi:hypothetical protein
MARREPDDGASRQPAASRRGQIPDPGAFPPPGATAPGVERQVGGHSPSPASEQAQPAAESEWRLIDMHGFW